MKKREAVRFRTLSRLGENDKQISPLYSESGVPFPLASMFRGQTMDGVLQALL
jgi:hypothetical protein